MRIPVGYWAFNPNPADPYVQGQLPFLDNAIRWARNSGLRVMLDLHGGMFSFSWCSENMLTYKQLPGLKMVSIIVENMAVSTGNLVITLPIL